MGGRLRVLVCEDNVDDFDLLLLELRRSGHEVEAERVDTADDMRAALASRPWDLVFSDWAMPSFTAPDALEVLHQRGLDIPFIIVSGTVDEETVVEALRNGAHDFLVKAKLTRLGVIVERELREANTRRERGRMQEQLLISDRMASVGILAAGVAHEINNPLAAVIANLHLALDDVSKVENVELRANLHDELKDAVHAADRVRHIVRDLRIFSRTEEEARSLVDVEAVMESTIRMASNEVRHRAKLVREFQAVPPVQASEARLGQVFLNLIVNAAQALPEGRADKNEIRIEIALDGARVRIAIADTGPGLSREAMRQLFTPFYTTKPASVGTGLGLSICHRIVTSLGGEISVESTPGAGATFVVLLPVAGPGVPEHAAPEMPLHEAARRGRVLIIDDEPMIARAIERAIGGGHDVTLVERAADALQLISDGAHYDVILCDLMMPEITGMDLHEALTRLAPEQARAMIFLTGGAFTPRAREFLDHVDNARIEKPFDLTHLCAMIDDRMR